eukprot:CAMPEP_0202889346 /NCGR_PEP_ID=MMETSP1391-20130828/43654_1 /ASSEMBLY_ACC=CAM_ASM_000867 /TAXON_ID=1034604 /ORGANISM="Chlamydomonas leiostraca, Strain SAG 11-49" /LENGTH=94 /DNA_ID=CAMNT_0049572667 /DNA_START=586 /DNA_END=869 /DNA_ORIENTATION=+
MRARCCVQGASAGASVAGAVAGVEGAQPGVLAVLVARWMAASGALQCLLLLEAQLPMQPPERPTCATHLDNVSGVEVLENATWQWWCITQETPI